MNSFSIPLQRHWSHCQYCTYSNSDSHTGLYWHWVMEQTRSVFVIWPVICARRLRFVYFIVCTVELYFNSALLLSCSGRLRNFVLLHTPLPFIFPNASSCASWRWLGSRADWITMMVSVLSWVPVPPQSKHSTVSFSVFSPPSYCSFHFVLALPFKSHSFRISLVEVMFSYLPHCLFFAFICSQTHCYFFFCSEHVWHSILTLLLFLVSLTSKANFCLQTMLQQNKQNTTSCAWLQHRR